MNTWSKKIVEWTEGNKAYLSVVFTWDLPKAWSRCIWYREQGYEVIAGGPAVSLMPDYLSQVSSNHVQLSALNRHNPDATFTSRGCIRSCSFCAVPKIEGDLVELETWEPKPIICDNNLLACSRKHFDRVIDSLKTVKGVDFNQGLDCRLLNDHHIERLQELDIEYIRFSWDYIDEEAFVMDAIKRVREAGFPKDKIRVYVLYNYNESPDDATYRLKTLYKMHIVANPMRFQPLEALVRDNYVWPTWNKRELKRFTRYWNRSNWLGGIPYEDFRG